jgi:hypothetical protein
LLNGAILGYLGDLHSDVSAYELAIQLVERLDDGQPETLRLLAMNAARPGRWRDALNGARKRVDANPKARRKYTRWRSTASIGSPTLTNSIKRFSSPLPSIS